MDDYGAHKHPEGREWFARHPGPVPRFTPTGASRLDRVERSFAQITGRRIRRGSFRSLEDPERATADHPKTHNREPRPFVWTKSAGLILGKIRRTRERLVPNKS
jgi:hypothetical protein